MFKATDKFDQIGKALIEAQGEFKSVPKNQQGYGYRYADLQDVCAMAYPVLHKHSIGVVQTFGAGPGEGHLIVTTTLIHTSGQTLQGDIAIPLPANVDAQKLGAAATYGRRYGLSALLGIVTEEDTDAAELKGQPPAKRVPPKKKPDAMVPERHAKMKAAIEAAAAAKGVDPVSFLADITAGAFTAFDQIKTNGAIDDVGVALNAAAKAAKGNSK